MTDLTRPIGVFDSGIGGLTVVKRIIEALPNENIVYFGDTARVPYGSKSNETVIEYSLQDTAFLMRHNVKAIVVACNTASAVAIPALRKAVNLPIIDMIDPGARFALRSTDEQKVGVIGTRATINNKAYSNAIMKLRPEVEVFEKPCPLFVPLAEEGWTQHEATKLIASEYLTELRAHGIDALILGCTHYPILSGVIQEVMGANVKLVDSGVAAAEVVRKQLDEIGLLSKSETPGSQEFFVSDVPTKFKEVAELFLGRSIENVHKVDLEELRSASRS